MVDEAGRQYGILDVRIYNGLLSLTRQSNRCSSQGKQRIDACAYEGAGKCEFRKLDERVR